MLKSVAFGMSVKRTLFLLLTLFTFSLANTMCPHLYKAIGTPVYQAADGYRALADSKYFTASKEAMQRFIEESDQLKNEGFGLDKESSKEERKVYITALRQLDKQRKQIDRLVVKSIRTLKAQKLHAELSVLATNPYLLIRKMAKGQTEQKMVSDTKQMITVEKDTETLRRSLMSLREELQHSRAKNAENVACLNDITAINHLMLKSDELKLERKWCKAYDICRQIIEFERDAQKSCGKENSRYLEWSGASLPYRTTYRQMFEEACQR